MLSLEAEVANVGDSRAVTVDGSGGNSDFAGARGFLETGASMMLPSRSLQWQEQCD